MKAKVTTFEISTGMMKKMPLTEERYLLVCLKSALEQPAVQRLLALLRSEVERGEFLDQCPLHLRLLEVEPGQVPVHGEASRLHLVRNGAHRPVRIFGLQQMLHQPA